MQARCAICRDFFTANGISAIRCGHTFHHTCLLQWFAQSARRTCPTCRFELTKPEDMTQRLIFDFGHNGPIMDACREAARKADQCKEQLETLGRKLHVLQQENARSNVRINELSGHVTTVEAGYQTITDLNRALETSNAGLRAERTRLIAENARLGRMIRNFQETRGLTRMALRLAPRTGIPVPVAAATGSGGDAVNGGGEASDDNPQQHDAVNGEDDAQHQTPTGAGSAANENAIRNRPASANCHMHRLIQASRTSAQRGYSIAFGSTYRRNNTNGQGKVAKPNRKK